MKYLLIFLIVITFCTGCQALQEHYRAAVTTAKAVQQQQNLSNEQAFDVFVNEFGGSTGLLIAGAIGAFVPTPYRKIAKSLSFIGVNCFDNYLDKKEIAKAEAIKAKNQGTITP